MITLNILAQNRDNLLLLEALGWLHDYRKCADEHLRRQAANLTRQHGLSRSALGTQQSTLSGIQVDLPIQPQIRTVVDLLDNRTQNTDMLSQILVRCHHTSHFDKQDPVGGQQNYPGIRLSTPLGFEKVVPADLTNRLWRLPWGNLVGYTEEKREDLQKEIQALFSQAVADTRRPINEVDLWSWGLLVGALYKAALAGVLLAGTSAPQVRALRWRLLGVRVNGLDYLLNVAHIPDTLARQDLLRDALKQVRHLVEVTYPLGSEVYRDENGSLFVVPDIADLLDRTDHTGTSLRSLILQAFGQGTVKDNPNLRIGPELEPYLELEAPPWWGQDPAWPNSSTNDEIPRIADFLAQKIVSAANAAAIESLWQRTKATNICTVCGLRPQGPGSKAAERNVCDCCEERREERSKKWAETQLERTIWTNEIADGNGRLALIVGQFDLTHWLDGRLLDSLFAISPQDPHNTRGKPVTSKTPSFSRLRRLWETTRIFWREVEIYAQSSTQMQAQQGRLQIHLDAMPNLGPFHVYELVLGPTNLNVVWVPPKGENAGYLITAENLCYCARQLGAEPAVFADAAMAVDFVAAYLNKALVEPARCPLLFNPDTPGTRGAENLLGGIHITTVTPQPNPYAQIISILAEPQRFMVLVPADQSIDTLRIIKQKYEAEMGKVRDRLPLHLGCVYANRKTPAQVLLDAGRSMLKQPLRNQLWRVKQINIEAPDPPSQDHFAQVLDLDLEREKHHLHWQMPLRMGDGVTDDQWYPYMFLETGGDDSTAAAQTRRAVKVNRPVGVGQATAGWVVHAADLRPGETIYLWPSTFDFEFLDSTARRFQIAYDENGRRSRRTRPFYLEDLDRLEMLWKYIKRGLSSTQCHQVIRTIESTREAWYGQDRDGSSASDEVLQQFVADTLAGAGWHSAQPWESIPQEWQEHLIAAGVSGELADLAELQLEILKE